MDLGLERAGMKIVWQVEIDDWCTKVLEKHWPGVKRYGDVKEINGEELERVDLVCGGFPCQPASTAGKRKGLVDNRWLWSEFYRIVRQVRPRWVLAENVPGLLSVNSGQAFGEVVGDLASSGYTIEWDCIPAIAVGAPHIRDRVWIVANSDGDGEGRLSEEFQAGEYEPSRNGEISDTYCPDEGAQEYRSGRPIKEENRGESLRDEPGRFHNIFRIPGDFGGFEWWSTEPDLGRVVDGVPHRLDRLRGLGNAVVPQVVEWIGRRIINNEFGPHT